MSGCFFFGDNLSNRHRIIDVRSDRKDFTPG
jgi:hypothetical protein